MRAEGLHREVIEPKVADHDGRIFGSAGDSVIAEFSSPVEAVRCAVDVQEALASDATQEGSERLQLRIGINLGDIMVEGDRYVRGRSECSGAAGAARRAGWGLCLRQIYEEVRDKLPYTFHVQGRAAGQEHRAASPHLFAPWRTAPGLPEAGGGALCSPLRTVPLLQSYLSRISAVNPSRVYFSDGLTEDVITELSRFRELMVHLHSNSSFSFRGQSLDMREIGRFLRYRIWLRAVCGAPEIGFVSRRSFLHCASGANLWGERLRPAPYNDVFAIQEEIASSIVATVVQRVVRDSELAARRRVPENIRAYDLFLQGNHLTDAFAPEAQARAEVLFERALQIDPGFARAHTGLAWIYRNRSEECAVGVPRAKDENKVKALHEAERRSRWIPMTLGFISRKVT